MRRGPIEPVGGQFVSHRTAALSRDLLSQWPVSTLPVSDHGVMRIRPGVELDDVALAAFATRHFIRRLAAFGSVLRNDFTPDSDVDVLVEFQPGHTPGLLGMAAMELELGALIGREVELRTYYDLSRYFRDDVRSSALELYAA